MKTSLQEMLNKNGDEASFMDRFLMMVTDEDENGKKSLDLSESVASNPFLIELSLAIKEILDEARRAEPEAELTKLTGKKNADTKAAQFSVFWKNEVISACENATKLIRNIEK